MTRRDFGWIVLVMMIWGVNFSMIKMGVTAVDPLLMVAARFALAVFPIIFFIPKPDVPWKYLVGYGLAFGVGVWGMASWSISAGVSSGMASVLLQSKVLLSIVIGVLVYREAVGPAKAFGSMLALAGLVVAVTGTEGNVTLFGLVLILIASCSWLAANMIVKQAKVAQVFAFNVWGMLFAPLPLVGLSLGLNGTEVLSQAYQVWDMKTSIAVLFQSYPTTLFGYWLWNRMMLKYPMSTVAPLSLLVPVFGLLSGWLIYDEALSEIQIAASAIFLAGTLLITAPAGWVVRIRKARRCEGDTVTSG
ncbi:EamA family transporter [Photobacterium atrarenae]|uniref:EamA family transporter n=1 Tax=Photobacterium atrarenae TaxID=865757 RepID=A0ABY5GKC3_9GAMM|nr:EamA family transporter [Photobacterium atrarenae]UTV29565.1 EamA family transporter [Photobacterium atrarenae]